MENDTNSTNPNTTSISSPHVYQEVLGCLAFFLVLPFVLIPFSRYPLGSTGAVLVGAFLMVTTTVISQSEVYKVIGDVNNLKTIFLLWGMMVISSYFERERLIDRLLGKFFPSGLSFHWWIVRLSIIDSILAALFTNDVACVILTPLILKKWIEQSRDKNELNTLLLALATQANIGKLDSMNFSYDSFITFRKYIDDFW
jgi:Na+/H+ antiporter NhaD/arsenite permease-like protein